MVRRTGGLADRYLFSSLLPLTTVQEVLAARWTSASGTEFRMLCSHCSVFDVDDERNPEEKKNGFVFDDPNEGVSTLKVSRRNIWLSFTLGYLDDAVRSGCHCSVVLSVVSHSYKYTSFRICTGTVKLIDGLGEWSPVRWFKVYGIEDILRYGFRPFLSC